MSLSNHDVNGMITRSSSAKKNLTNRKCEASPSVKLTFKLGGQTIEKNVDKSNLDELEDDQTELTEAENQDEDYQFDEDFNESLEIENGDDEDYEEYNEVNGEERNVSKSKGWTKKDIRERVLSKSSRKKSLEDEDAWLEALEEGRLHEVDDELKRIKDPKLMTVRQKALLESKTLKRKQEALRQQEIEIEAKSKVGDEETIERKMIRAKRRQKAEEKKAKDTKDLIDRLLKKRTKDTSSETGLKSGHGAGAKSKRKKMEYSKITYINNQQGVYICLPANLIDSFKLTPKVSINTSTSLTPTKCAREGCGNTKKYSCSKSRLPCCSFECYKIIENIFNSHSNSSIDLMCN